MGAHVAHSTTIIDRMHDPSPIDDPHLSPYTLAMSAQEKNVLKPHLKLEPGQMPERVIVCGDPARAEKIASQLTDARPLAKNREYHSYAGKYNGKTVGVLSHGVGSAGAAIAFQELFDLGVKQVIRVGTAGGLQKNTAVAGAVIATAAVRRDGVSRSMIPAEYPAVADHALCDLLFDAAKKRGGFSSTDRGIVLTSDLFYPGLIDDDLKLYSRAGVLAVEMEISTLFVIASLRNVRAGAIVVLDGNPLKWDDGVYEPGSDAVKNSTVLAITVALDAITA